MTAILLLIISNCLTLLLAYGCYKAGMLQERKYWLTKIAEDDNQLIND